MNAVALNYVDLSVHCTSGSCFACGKRAINAVLGESFVFEEARILRSFNSSTIENFRMKLCLPCFKVAEGHAAVA